MRIIRFATVLLLGAGTASAGTQSLADVARKEEARRKTIAKPARVITNKDLKPSEIPLPQAGSDESAAAAPRADEQKPADTTEDEQAKDDQAKGEEAWRRRMGDARQNLEHSEMYLDALQNKVNSLWADFTSRDDPAQRALIEADRKKALAELDRVKQEVQDRKKAIDDLEEEARKAGVPPGWLR
jgi:hypothetical protein